MRIKKSDRLEVKDHTLKVNGKTFILEYPEEPIACMDRNRLVTILIKGCGISLNYWDPEDIEGYFA